MATSILGADRVLRPCQPPADPEATQVTGLVPLLFALNYATALPPHLLTFPKAGFPEVRPGRHAIIGADQLALILNWKVREVGRGRIMLNEVDERLDGLTMLLEAFQVSNGSHALVALGMIQSDLAAVGGRATIASLWQLAREATTRPAASCLHPVGFGHDAFQVIYGKTALLAWLSGDRLVTISVTDLRGDAHHVVRVAQAIAASTAQYLTRRTQPAH